MNKKIHVKTGDQVKVISGAQKGFLGKIQAINNKKSSVILEGIPTREKRIRNSQSNENQIKKVELPTFIHLSNVMLWDKTINKPSRIGYKFLILEKEKKVSFEKKRYFKKSGTII